MAIAHPVSLNFVFPLMQLPPPPITTHTHTHTNTHEMEGICKNKYRGDLTHMVFVFPLKWQTTFKLLPNYLPVPTVFYFRSYQCWYHLIFVFSIPGKNISFEGLSQAMVRVVGSKKKH